PGRSSPLYPVEGSALHALERSSHWRAGDRHAPEQPPPALASSRGPGPRHGSLRRLSRLLTESRRRAGSLVADSELWSLTVPLRRRTPQPTFALPGSP